MHLSLGVALGGGLLIMFTYGGLRTRAGLHRKTPHGVVDVWVAALIAFVVWFVLVMATVGILSQF